MTEVSKLADAGGSASPQVAPRPRRHDPVWLFYVWPAPYGRTTSIAEPIGEDEQGARRMLEGLIDLYHLPADGTWHRGPKQAL